MTRPAVPSSHWRAMAGARTTSSVPTIRWSIPPALWLVHDRLPGASRRGDDCRSGPVARAAVAGGRGDRRRCRSCRRYPEHRHGFRSARHTASDEVLRAAEEPQVEFNYLGRFDLACPAADSTPVTLRGHRSPISHSTSTCRSTPSPTCRCATPRRRVGGAGDRRRSAAGHQLAVRV